MLPRRLAVIVIEHNVPELARFVDRVMALDAGQVVAEGAPADLVRHQRVLAAYLGEAA
jgi:ABC-type branched-subunit amino acid transport system ATPase component